jgi:predicted metal-dependent HD superfamily phosphohydrolase
MCIDVVSNKIETPRSLLEAKIEKIFNQKPLQFEYIQMILDAYSEPWRTYHNCTHILKMLQVFEETSIDLPKEYLHLIELMIIYHDVIYKLGREKGWNENESVFIAENQLNAAGYTTLKIDLVVEGIKSTINHVVSEDFDAWREYIEPFLDIDLLAGFGTKPEEFLRNTKLIGKELSPFYTDEEYAESRAKFAKAFLQRPNIFLSPYFRQYETKVRESLFQIVEV